MSEDAILKLSKKMPRLIDEPDAFKRACLRMGYEAGFKAALDAIEIVQVGNANLSGPVEEK